MLRTVEHLDDVTHEDWVLARTVKVGDVVAAGVITNVVWIDPGTILLRFDSRRTQTAHPKDRLPL